jgi:threonine/homoserine/homoserine lactone efflux protein
MHLEFLFKGLVTGLLVSLPLGPLAVLTIQRTANKDFKSGIDTGLGIALADTIWALLAGFSLSYIITFLRDHQTTLQIIGAIVLFFLGLSIFNSHPAHAIRKYKRQGANPFQCFGSAVLIAFSNPLVVLAYIAVFASTNIVFDIHQPSTPLLFALGFLMGSLSWWTIIVTTVTRFRHHFNLRILWWFNKISGVLIIFFVLITTIIFLVKGNPSF